jgi:uncharacterized protein (DUF58 family)
MKSPNAVLNQWLLSRLRPTQLHTLKQRNVYIVPTRAGLAFALTLVLLLLASINYQLNLGYALTFLLAGSALASMHMTHGSLRGLSLHVKPPAPTFVGASLALDIVVTNPSAARHGLGLGLEHPAESRSLAWATAPAESQATVSVACIAARRGRMELPVLRIESRFPFGLFRAWSVWRPAGQVWIYPKPETPAPALPPTEAVAHQGAPAALAAASAEFDGVRPWRQGDSQRQVVWKKMARSGQLVSRDSRQNARPQLWLDWRMTPPGDPEARLSRLAAWVLEAQARQMVYGLRLPGSELGLGEGQGQRDAALQRLAEWS